MQGVSLWFCHDICLKQVGFLNCVVSGAVLVFDNHFTLILVQDGLSVQ